MPGSNIDVLIEELEHEINSGRAPFGGGAGRKIIESDNVYGILDDLKKSIPVEWQEARRILRQKEQIIQEAQDRARQMIADAEDKAQMLASNQEVVRVANDMAAQIEREARANERDIHYWAENTAEKIFQRVEEELSVVIDHTRQALEETVHARQLLEPPREDGGNAPELDLEDENYDR